MYVWNVHEVPYGELPVMLRAACYEVVAIVPVPVEWGARGAYAIIQRAPERGKVIGGRQPWQHNLGPDPDDPESWFTEPSNSPTQASPDPRLAAAKTR
jgi:hypothetical protein